MSCEKTAEVMEMLFEEPTWINGPLDEGPDRKRKKQFWGLSAPLKSTGSLCCGVRKAAEPIEMQFGGLTQEGPRKHVRWGRGRTNAFAVAAATRRRCGLASKFFDNLFIL